MPALHRSRCGAWLSLLLTAALGLPGAAAATQVGYGSDAPVSGDTQVEYYADAGGTLDFEHLRAAPTHYLHPLRTRGINFGLSSSAYWLHLSIASRGPTAAVAYLSIAQPTLDDARLYVLDRDTAAVQTVRAGDELPSGQQLVHDGHPVLPIDVRPGGHYELYLRLASRAGALLAPIEFQGAAGLQRSERVSVFFNGIISGMLGALLLYNAMLYCSLRQPAYLYYVLLLPMTYLACTGSNGFGAAMLYPSWVWPANEGVPLFAGVAFCLNMLFARALLGTRGLGWLDRLLLAVAALALLLALSSWLLPIAVAYGLAGVLMLLVPLAGALAGGVALRRGHPQARFYLLGQSAAWVGLLIFVLSNLGVIGYHYWARESITIGVALNALLLSLALADRIRALQQSSARAETRARQALDVRQQDLERSVAERTRELEQARQHAVYLATIDALTGIYNRRGLMPLVERAVQQANSAATPLSLICFDLDHFKQVNDDFGHAEGDQVLRDLVAQTRKLIRQSDLFGRTGGEEFMLVLSAPLASSVQRAEELRRHLQLSLRAGKQQRPVTASFGVAMMGDSLRSLEALQQAADAALYRAKNRGRNRVEAYGEDAEGSTRTRAIMSRALGLGAASGRFRSEREPR